MSKTEQPKYSVLQSDGNIEIRQYDSMIVAETIVNAERNQANNAAFSILANYIFGANTPATAIAMTTPVTQSQQSEKIAMTAPVTQQEMEQTGGNTWAVQFMMPSQYTLETLPKPSDPRITIKTALGKKVAAIRFSGSAGEKQLRENEAKLRAFLSQKAIETQGKIMYAFYDSPFTLPLFRRNEIMIEVL